MKRKPSKPKRKEYQIEVPLKPGMTIKDVKDLLSDREIKENIDDFKIEQSQYADDNFRYQMVFLLTELEPSEKFNKRIEKYEKKMNLWNKERQN